MPKLPDWDLPDALENAIGDANEDAKAELDRLRAQKAEANNQWRLDYNACAAERDRQRTEINRLKSENAELRGWLEAAINEIDNPLITMHMSAILAKTSEDKPDYAPARDSSDHLACGNVG